MARPKIPDLTLARDLFTNIAVNSGLKHFPAISVDYQILFILLQVI